MGVGFPGAAFKDETIDVVRLMLPPLEPEKMVSSVGVTLALHGRHMGVTSGMEPSL